jgi:hypothetical protein
MPETHSEKRLIGYARVSTYGETLDSQLEQLGNVRVNTIRMNPDYDLEFCDGVRSDTGKLEIIKFAPKSGNGPCFIGRWDQKTERLDIDMYGASKTATKGFKKGKAGYSGHHPNRNADPNTRTFEFRIDTPSVGLVFEGSVSFANTFQVMAKFEATTKLSIGIQVHRGGTTLNGQGYFSA